MIKIQPLKLDNGTNVYLPETWHELLLNSTKNNSFPYEFNYLQTINENDNLIYIFKNDGKGKLVGFKEDVLKYLYGIEVPNTNVGFSFKEYLPNENTDIMITHCNNSSIKVATLKINHTIEVSEQYGKISVFDFVLIDVDESKDALSLSHYTSRKRGDWKFLFNDDISYMTDIEKMYQDTYVHKKYVIKSCTKLANYLREQGIVEHANQLMDRAIIHDNSKIYCDDETRALSLIINDKSCLNEASKSLSQIKTDALKLHWKHNSHHPEHFSNYADMSKLDIMEMCCDWHARSTQYNTNLLEFLEVRQKERFHFPEYMYLEIKYYCEILLK